MRAFVTVIGNDKVGIIARVCSELAENQVNILDISQTILHERFTMVMLVDASASTVPFDTLAEKLSNLGDKMELNIRLQREEIFNAMHRI